ncbi:MBL fold metallo-hydrolase [Candidatus Uabimicrobium sp. HlEnr_7]|uniref:MBL fold metallo-hydrolase n=1 Tax=Candidatus Uabimicrobium helgolandensis TaxID=3095367 RepID=UPI0035581FDF
MKSFLFFRILFVVMSLTILCAQKSEDCVTYEFFRNATAKLTYGSKNNKQVFLLDPMFSKKGELPSFAGIEKNPTVDLPKSIDYILEGVDAVVVGHMHADHFDMAAASYIHRHLPIITPDNKSPMHPQNPDMVTFTEQLQAFGFSNVKTIGSVTSKSIFYNKIEIIQEFGLHGKGTLTRFMGGVNGLVFRAQKQPTIYWTGDTILDEEGRVENILRLYAPDIIIVHTGGAVVEQLSPDPLMMDEEQAINFILAAKKYNSSSKIIAIHMGSLDHCFTTRDKLRQVVTTLGEEINKDVIIPNNGDVITIPSQN